MAVGIRLKFAGVTQEQFDAANAQVDLASDPPAGLLFHSSGPIEGGWGVIDFWESREAFEAFAPVIGQAAEGAGMAGQEPPDVKEFPVHEYFSA